MMNFKRIASLILVALGKDDNEALKTKLEEQIKQWQLKKSPKVYIPETKPRKKIYQFGPKKELTEEEKKIRNWMKKDFNIHDREEVVKFIKENKANQDPNKVLEFIKGRGFTKELIEKIQESANKLGIAGILNYLKPRFIKEDLNDLLSFIKKNYQGNPMMVANYIKDKGFSENIVRDFIEAASKKGMTGILEYLQSNQEYRKIINEIIHKDPK